MIISSPPHVTDFLQPVTAEPVHVSVNVFPSSTGQTLPAVVENETVSVSGRLRPLQLHGLPLEDELLLWLDNDDCELRLLELGIELLIDELTDEESELELDELLGGESELEETDEHLQSHSFGCP